MAKPDGLNPLARVLVFGTMHGTIIADCHCGETLFQSYTSTDLQHLVIKAQEHAKECPLHKANLEVVE